MSTPTANTPWTTLHQLPAGTLFLTRDGRIGVRGLATFLMIGEASKQGTLGVLDHASLEVCPLPDHMDDLAAAAQREADAHPNQARASYCEGTAHGIHEMARMVRRGKR